MKVEVTESGTWRRTLEVEAPAEAVEERFEAAYRNYSKTLNLPGFRKGRVPVRIVRARFGKAIQGEVLPKLIEEFYQEACETEGLTPISDVSIEEMDFDEGQPLRFKASVDVKPEPHVEHYRGLRVTRPVFRVEESHEEEQLRQLQEQNATEQVVERPAALGDVLLADIQELDASGLPIIGRRQENSTLYIGNPNATNHDLDNQLVGIAVGEERRIRLTQSEDHPDPEQAGQEIRFQVTVKEVRERNVPELDDEFAKDMGDFESLDALKTRIREDLQGRADYTSRMRLQENLIDALIRENEVEIPESMVTNYLDNLIESHKKEHEGHDHDIDEAAIRQESRTPAIRSIKRYLFLEAIARQEGLEVTEEDVDGHFQNLSERYGIAVPRLRQSAVSSGQLERTKSELLDAKVLALLVEQAEIEDVEEVTEEQEPSSRLV